MCGLGGDTLAYRTGSHQSGFSYPLSAVAVKGLTAASCPLSADSSPRPAPLRTSRCARVHRNLAPRSRILRFKSFRSYSEHKKRRMCASFQCLWLRGKDLNLRPPGDEPDELPTALPRAVYIYFYGPTLLNMSPPNLFYRQIGAGDRGRTGTIGKDRRILSPVRLPIPPLRQKNGSKGGARTHSLSVNSRVLHH